MSGSGRALLNCRLVLSDAFESECPMFHQLRIAVLLLACVLLSFVPQARAQSTIESSAAALEVDKGIIAVLGHSQAEAAQIVKLASGSGRRVYFQSSSAGAVNAVRDAAHDAQLLAVRISADVGPLSSIHLSEWVGNAGIAWGISEDSTALPKKQQQCMALIIQRTEPNEPARLILQRMIVGEMLFDVQWVNSVFEIARMPLEISDPGFHFLELEIRDSDIEVFWDGKSIWKPTIRDPSQRAALVNAEGAVGLVGHGKSVVFRDTNVKFFTPTRKSNK